MSATLDIIYWVDKTKFCFTIGLGYAIVLTSDILKKSKAGGFKVANRKIFYATNFGLHLFNTNRSFFNINFTYSYKQTKTHT